MAKYENKAERVFVIGGNKFLIPGTDPVELTADEEKIPMVQKYIKDGHLVKVEETTTTTETSLDSMTVKQLQDYAASNNIALGDATKKEDILALIKAAKAGE